MQLVECCLIVAFSRARGVALGMTKVVSQLWVELLEQEKNISTAFGWMSVHGLIARYKVVH